MKKTNLAQNTIILGICTLLNKGLLFVMVPFFSRWLSTEEFGLYDLLSTYVTLLIPVITLSCSDAIFRLSLDKDEKEYKSFYITNGLGIVAINSIISVVVISLFFHYTHNDNCIPFLALLLGETVDNYLQGYLRAIKKINVYAICKTLSVVFTAIIVSVLILVFHMGLAGILYGYAFGFFMSDVVAVFVTKFPQYIDRKKFSLPVVKEMLGYSLPLVPNSLSWWVINVSDRTIINLVLGAASNGIYAIAYKIPNLCSAVFGVFNISWQEAATDMSTEANRNGYYNSVFDNLLGVLFSLCGGILSLNYFFFFVIFDSKYSDAYLYAPILVASVLFSSISTFFGGIQISLKRPKANGLSTVIGAVVNLIVHIGLVSYVGLYAAAFSTLISNITISIIRVWMLKDTVVFKLDNKQYIYAGIFLYLFIAAYWSKKPVFATMNVAIATIFFCIVNKNNIMKILLKVSKK